MDPSFRAPTLGCLDERPPRGQAKAEGSSAPRPESGDRFLPPPSVSSYDRSYLPGTQAWSLADCSHGWVCPRRWAVRRSWPALPLPPRPPRRESRAELQRALIGWAHWHTQRYLPGYLPPSVASGRLAVEPARLLGGSLLAAPGSGWNGGGSGGSWAVEDVPAAPTALPPNFNVAYEQVRQGQ